MKCVAAYALLVVGGNAAPSAADVIKVIVAAGGEADEAQIAALLGDLEGKSIHELLAKGEKDLEACAGVAVAAGKFMISPSDF
jgi:large subunit ribosomal protein LP2